MKFINRSEFDKEYEERWGGIPDKTEMDNWQETDFKSNKSIFKRKKYLSRMLEEIKNEKNTFLMFAVSLTSQRLSYGGKF